MDSPVTWVEWFSVQGSGLKRHGNGNTLMGANVIFHPIGEI
jgi:hypothetical protein